MNRLCCICGGKAPKKILDSAWVALRVDADPCHYFCPVCKPGVDFMAHSDQWRARQIGCRVNSAGQIHVIPQALFNHYKTVSLTNAHPQ